MNNLLARSAALAALLATPLLTLGPAVHAQSGAPASPTEAVVAVAPGTEVVDASYPSIAPDNIPAATGQSVLGVVPSGPEGSVSLISGDFGAGLQATAVVPVDPSNELAVSFSAVEAVGLPADVAANLNGPAVVVTVNVYEVATGAQVDVPVSVGISVPPGMDPSTLNVVHFNPATGEYQTLSTTVDPVTGAVQVQIP